MTVAEPQKSTFAGPTTAVVDHRPFWYSEALALSLLQYAKGNPHFASVLADMAKALPLPINLAPELDISKPVNLLLPIDEAYAVERAEWLIPQLLENKLAGAASASRLLTTWANDPASRRQLIVGVVGVAIPGITLGYISRRLTMSIIVRQDQAKQNELQLARQVSQVSLHLVSRSLRQAHGKADQIEPELADWFFGEQAMMFYQATAEQLKGIETELRRMDVPYAALNKGETTGVMAISPVVNGSALGLPLQGSGT